MNKFDKVCRMVALLFILFNECSLTLYGLTESFPEHEQG